MIRGAASDRWHRAFAISDGAIEATYEDGSLSVRIPKSAAKKPRGKQIEIG